jgi:hypothetical protein
MICSGEGLGVLRPYQHPPGACSERRGGVDASVDVFSTEAEE